MAARTHKKKKPLPDLKTDLELRNRADELLEAVRARIAESKKLLAASRELGKHFSQKY